MKPLGTSNYRQHIPIFIVKDGLHRLLRSFVTENKVGNMAHPSFPLYLALLACLAFYASPVAAFGAGNIGKRYLVSMTCST